MTQFSRSRSGSGLRAITVRMDDDTLSIVKRECERLGISQSEFIRGALQRRLGVSVDPPPDEPAPAPSPWDDEALDALARRVEMLRRIVVYIADSLGLSAKGSGLRGE